MNSCMAFEERIRQASILDGPCACIVVDINDLKQANDANIYRLGGVVV